MPGYVINGALICLVALIEDILRAGIPHVQQVSWGGGDDVGHVDGSSPDSTGHGLAHEQAFRVQPRLLRSAAARSSGARRPVSRPHGAPGPAPPLELVGLQSLGPRRVTGSSASP